MTEIVVIVVLVAVAGIAAYLLGKERVKSKTAQKTATTARKQTQIARKKRKRTAKGVAEDIKKGGL